MQSTLLFCVLETFWRFGILQGQRLCADPDQESQRVIRSQTGSAGSAVIRARGYMFSVRVCVRHMS